jgi:hypothetical protein
MERIPSVGPAEIILVVVATGLVFLVGAAIVALVVTRRRGGDSQAAAPSEKEVAPPRSSRALGWIVVIVLLAVLAIPLCVVLGGVLWVTPVTRTVVGESGLEPEIHVVEQGQPIVTLSPVTTEPFGTPSPGAQSSGAARRASTPPGRSALLSLNPFNPVAFVMLLGLAGLVLLLGVAVVAAVGKGWKGTDEPSGAIQANGDFQETGSGAEKLRPVLLALVLWIALSVFLVLDLVFQVSLYWQFVVMYAAFWLLVGALLATGRPLRDKLLILGVFVLVLGSVRFVDWNSRKAFLRDFHGLREGMTVEEVDQIMSGYMKAYGGGPPQSQNEYEFDEQGEVVAGWVTYRHTNEGWGDSDWGVVTVENGQVVRLQFLPD